MQHILSLSLETHPVVPSCMTEGGIWRAGVYRIDAQRRRGGFRELVAAGEKLIDDAVSQGHFKPGDDVIVCFDICDERSRFRRLLDAIVRYRPAPKDAEFFAAKSRLEAYASQVQSTSAAEAA